MHVHIYLDDVKIMCDLLAHLFVNSLTSCTSQVMTATNMCSNFGGFKCSHP